jgi:hypothetical protein
MKNLQYFSTFSHTWHDLLAEKKVIGHKMCFDFLYVCLKQSKWKEWFVLTQLYYDLVTDKTTTCFGSWPSSGWILGLKENIYLLHRLVEENY